MSRSRGFPFRVAFVMVAAFGIASVDSPASAQPVATRPTGGLAAVKLKEPVASRVYQRDANGRAEIPIVLDDPPKDAKLVDARVNGPNTRHDGDQVCRRQAGRRAGRRPLHDQLSGRDRQACRQRDRRPGLRRRPLGAGRPVEHGGGRRPDRRDAAAPPGHAARHGRQVGAGRGAAPLAGRLARPGPLGRPQDPRRAVGTDPQEPSQRCRPGVAVRRGDGRGDRGPDRPGRLRPRRHEHGAVEPGQEGPGRQQPLWLDAATVPARRRQGQGRALVSGRERCHGRRRLRRSYPQVFSHFIDVRPLRLRPARAAILLRPDRPVRPRRRSQGLEHRPGSPAADSPSESPTRP